jgi:hypothetical protein
VKRKYFVLLNKPFYKYLGRDPHYKQPYNQLWFVRVVLVLVWRVRLVLVRLVWLLVLLLVLELAVLVY